MFRRFTIVRLRVSLVDKTSLVILRDRGQGVLKSVYSLSEVKTEDQQWTECQQDHLKHYFIIAKHVILSMMDNYRFFASFPGLQSLQKSGSRYKIANKQ